MVLFCLLVTGTSAAPPGSIAPKSSKRTFGATIVFRDRNATCRDAQEIPRVAYATNQYGGEVEDQVFSGANNVDDWYKYETSDYYPSGYEHWLYVRLTSDYPQTEVAIYYSCSGWPLNQSIFDGGSAPTALGDDNPLSGLTKEFRIERKANHYYYIHVNCLSKPEDSSKITYDLKVWEMDNYIPR
jgi:hypothetical protein